MNQNMTNSDYGMMPPQAVDLEEIILGSILIENDLWDKINQIIPEIFYKEANQIIFKSIQSLYSRKEAIDIMTVTEQLKKSGDLETIGGVARITELVSRIGSAAHFEYHLTIVIQKYILREIIRTTSEMSRAAYYDDDESIDICENKLTELQNFIINNTIGEINGKTIYNLTKKSTELAEIRRINREEGKDVGVPIPLRVIQDVIGGWQKQDLVIIAARPSMGKTAVAIDFAKYTAKRGYKTLFFSLEMSAISLNDRAILAEAEINPEDWRNGDIDNEDIEKVNVVANQVKHWNLVIYEKSAMRPEEIHSVCKKEKPELIIIDYIQLMRPNRGEKFNGNKNNEVGHITSCLKGIAKDFDIPVLALSQLNRELERRGSKVPGMADLRDSGNIEQDADIIIFPHRPYRYSNEETDKNKIEFYIAKHRNGRTGKVEAMHNDYINKFFDEQLSQDEQYFSERTISNLELPDKSPF